MSHQTLATLCLISAFTLTAACGSSERRGSATAYDGPTQIEGQQPDEGGSPGPGGFASTFAQIVIAQAQNDANVNALFCECTFEFQGYDSPEQCAQDANDDLDFQQALSACIADAISDLPAPPASIQRFATDALAASSSFDACIARINASSCDDLTTISDEVDACEDARDATLDAFDPSESDEAWIDQLEDAVDDADCFDFSPGPGQTPPSMGDEPSIGDGSTSDGDL